MKRFGHLLILCVLGAGIMPINMHYAEAQVSQVAMRPLPGIHISARAGIGYYGGDLDAVNLSNDATRLAFAGELIWHFTPAFGISVGYQQAEYPRIVDPLELRTAQLMLRVAPNTGRLSPYFQAGAHRTYGGLEQANGPVGGIGLNFALTSKLYLFTEANANFIFPDKAIDGIDGGSGFDILGFVGGGLRLANLGVRYNRGVEIGQVHIPDTVRAYEPVELWAEINDKATEPVMFSWDFGDGVMRQGNPITFTFVEAGPKDISVTAENSASADVQRVTFLVEPGTPPPTSQPTSSQPVVSEPAIAQPVATNAQPTTTHDPAPTEVAEQEMNPEVAFQLSELEQQRAEATLAISQAELAIAQAELALGHAKEAVTLARQASAQFGKTLPEFPIAEIQPEPEPQTPEPELTSQPADMATNTPDMAVPPASTPNPPADEPAVEEPAVAETPTAETPTATPQLETPEMLENGFTWVISSKPIQSEALAIANRYINAGYDCEIMRGQVQGVTVFRVTIGQFKTWRDALRAKQVQLPPDAPEDSWILAFNRDDMELNPAYNHSHSLNPTDYADAAPADQHP